MKFILTFTLPPETRDQAITRFLDTGGHPPAGAKLLGRWTQADLCGDLALLESEDPKALAAFAHSWSDLLGLTIVPALEDQELSEVLRRASAQPARAEAYREDSPMVPETTPGQTKPPYEEIA